jgi:hypothetical protein
MEEKQRFLANQFKTNSLTKTASSLLTYFESNVIVYLSLPLLYSNGVY